jgi:c-di-GMP-binding flagellar brake protein YcgR
LDILDAHSGELLGHLGDISLEGLMMVADQPLPLQQIRVISIQLPEDEELTESSIEVKIQVRWTRPDLNPNLHRIGCQFVDISEKNRIIIEQVEQILG